jgi:hypothetical protein
MGLRCLTPTIKHMRLTSSTRLEQQVNVPPKFWPLAYDARTTIAAVCPTCIGSSLLQATSSP